LDFIELAGEEVVRAFHPPELLGLGERSKELLDLGARPKGILRPLENQLGLGSGVKETQVGRTGRHANSHQGRGAGISRAHLESHPSSEGETHHTGVSPGVARLQMVERGAQVVPLASPPCEFSLTPSHAAKVEAQGRDSMLNRSLGRPVDDLVMQCPPVLGVGVAHDGGKP